jgi:hypothetical protein
MNEITNQTATAALNRAFESSLHAPSLALILDAYREELQGLLEKKRNIEVLLAQTKNRQIMNVAKIWALHRFEDGQDAQSVNCQKELNRRWGLRPHA